MNPVKNLVNSIASCLMILKSLFFCLNFYSDLKWSLFIVVWLHSPNIVKNLFYIQFSSHCNESNDICCPNEFSYIREMMMFGSKVSWGYSQGWEIDFITAHWWFYQNSWLDVSGDHEFGSLVTPPLWNLIETELIKQPPPIQKIYSTCPGYQFF